VTRRRARLAAAVPLAAGILTGTRADDGGGPAVVVADEQGRRVASLPLPAAGRFALRYRHSVYRAEVTETFALTPGGFQLVAVASPSDAVLDFYDLEGRRRSDGRWRRLEPTGTPSLASLPVLATEVGRRTLVVGDQTLPLFTEDGAPAHLVLTVRR
jgi:hypothetical protein